MPLDSPQYYVRRQGRVEGPWPVSKLQTEVTLKRLARYHEVSIDGQNWEPASSIADLFKKSVAPKVLGGAATTKNLDTETKGQDEDWYCVVNGNQQGPMTKAKLTEMIASGQLKLDDLVWREGLQDWLPLEEVAELINPQAARSESSAGSGMTEATRLIDLPNAPARKSNLGFIGLVLGCMLFIFSCVPFVGFLGIVPLALGGYALYEKKQTGAGDIRMIVASIVLGIIAITIGVISLAVGGFLLLDWNSD